MTQPTNIKIVRFNDDKLTEVQYFDRTTPNEKSSVWFSRKEISVMKKSQYQPCLLSSNTSHDVSTNNNNNNNPCCDGLLPLLLVNETKKSLSCMNSGQKIVTLTSRPCPCRRHQKQLRHEFVQSILSVQAEQQALMGMQDPRGLLVYSRANSKQSRKRAHLIAVKTAKEVYMNILTTETTGTTKTTPTTNVQYNHHEERSKKTRQSFESTSSSTTTTSDICYHLQLWASTA